MRFFSSLTMNLQSRHSKKMLVPTFKPGRHNLNLSPYCSLSLLGNSINGKSLTRETFKHLVVDARAKDHFSVLTIRELLADNGDGDVGVDGCVSHISTFASKDKETGAPKGESTSLTVISAAWKDGKRIMIDLTEVVG